MDEQPSSTQIDIYIYIYIYIFVWLQVRLKENISIKGAICSSLYPALLKKKYKNIKRYIFQIVFVDVWIVLGLFICREVSYGFHLFGIKFQSNSNAFFLFFFYSRLKW